MLKGFFKAVSCLAFVGFGLNAQAGHLFTQNTVNTPIALSAGFGITIPQDSMESTTGSQSGSYINVCEFGPGDALRVILPGYTQTFTYGSPPSGWTVASSASDPCPTEGYIETLNVTTTDDPALAALSLTVPFQWRIEATAGSFTLLGYRLRTTTGTVNGTGSGLVNQSNVTASGSAIPVFSPAHLALLILGLVALVAARRKFLSSGQHA